MELLNGDTLAARLRKKRRFPVDEALEILQQLTSALAAAHLHGIVHRDLKPSNVMLTPNPAMASGEQVKIVDFGIAKLLDENMHHQGGELKTETGKVLGTPQYMAPEQAKTTKVDGRADVYSVGAMAYEMLSGRMPYQMNPDELVWALLARKLTEPPPDLALLNPTLPKEIVQQVMTLLAKEPADRPTMAQLDLVLCKLRGLDPQKRSGIHKTVASEDPPSVSGLVTMDSPVAVALTLSQSPTVDERPGAPPPNLLSPPRPVSGAALLRGDGAVADRMPAGAMAPVRASAQVPAVALPAPAVVLPAPAVAPPAPTAAAAPTLRSAWLIGILAVVVVEVIAVVVYLAPGRPHDRTHGQQGRLPAGYDLASPPYLAAPADLARPPDLALSATLSRPTDAKPTDAKPKIEATLHPGHPAHCAAVTVTEACLHGKNLGQDLRRRILDALKDPTSKLRLCAAERLVVRIGESGVRVVDAPEHLSAKVQKDFELVLDGHLDGISHFGEIEILCSAPVR